MTMSAAVGVSRKPYKDWDAWWIERGALALVLVPQVGGRIMGMIWRGRDLAFTNAELEGRVENVAAVDDVRARKRELGFLLWGGDKTWLAPQGRWTENVPFIDLDSGAYSIEIERADANAAVVQMISPICRETGIQITRTVTVRARDEGWTVTHRLDNKSSRTVEWAAWDVSMVRRPAKVFLPKRSNSRHPGGVKTFANEGESEAVRDTVVSDLGNIVVVSCTEPLKFKFGADADLGSMLAVLDVEDLGLLGYRRHVPTFHPQPYGHDCVAEVFNASDYAYLELELHGPVVSLRPGEGFDLIERAALFEMAAWPRDASEVRKYLEP